jgi:maltooligosyltrehalose synthase
MLLDPAGCARMAAHVFAFARRHQARGAIVAVPRLVPGLGAEESAPPIGAALWDETVLALPAGPRVERLRCAIGGTEVVPEAAGARRVLRLGEVFARFPGALLRGV